MIAFSIQRSILKIFFSTFFLSPIPYSLLSAGFVAGSPVFAASSGDEITGGFRFVSPGVGNEKRWKVEGDRAEFISEDLIKISPVRAVVYGEKEPDYFVKADWARLNKVTKEVWTDSAVEITRGNSKLTGMGLHWEMAKKQATIMSHVKMMLSQDEAKQWSFD